MAHRTPFAAAAWLTLAAAAAASAQPPAVRLFDDDPAHPANALHAALFARAGPDGAVYGVDRLDPLLWEDSRHPLEEPAFSAALAAIDALLAAEPARWPALQRFLLQRDVWAMLAQVARPRRATERARAERLARALARALSVLTLTGEEIAALPDTYRSAVESGRHPAAFDPDRPERTFLPPGLLGDGADFVLVERADYRAAAPQHARAFPRSVFTVHVRLPGGRAATAAYLDRLAGQPFDADPFLEGSRRLPDFPPGTTWVLLRRALVLDPDLEPQASGVVESVQLRTYRRAEPAGPPDQQDPPQVGHELVLRRRELLRGEAGGLVPVTREDRDFAFVQFSSHGVDPFQLPDFEPPATAPVRLCTMCHFLPGVHSVISVVPHDGLPGHARVRPAPPGEAEHRARYEWLQSWEAGFLRGLSLGGR